jgi:hypothetical protein
MADAPVMLRTGRTLAQLCDAAGLSDEARALLAPGKAPRAFVEALIAAEAYPDAVGVLAHALPRREAVWWAWVCAKRAAGDAPPPAVDALLEATRVWIAEPTDPHRRAVMRQAEAVGFDTAAGCAGLAAFFSGESLAPPDRDPVPPGEFMAAKAIAGSVVLAAVATEPERAAEKFREYLEQGMVVADKTDLWTPPAAAARPGR